MALHGENEGRCGRERERRCWAGVAFGQGGPRSRAASGKQNGEGMDQEKGIPSLAKRENRKKKKRKEKKRR